MVKVHPRLETHRLRLRPFVAEDAARLAELAGAREIADTLISLPHPFSGAAARTAIAANASGFQSGRSVHFAIEPKSASELIGCIELREIEREHSQAELSFWIGREAWSQGYASEGAQATVRFGFEQLGLNRIYAYHMLRNPASGAVLLKAWMKQEGVLRERVTKWGVFEHVALYAVLRSDLAAT
jgi:RimJ/RimL family protein N-acetyltransferase